MKRTLLIIITTVILFPFSAFADNSQSQQISDSEKTYQDYMDKMQGHMNVMQKQMQEMQKTTDPKKRQKLLQEHWAEMNKGMQMMYGTQNYPGCGMMMGGPMMGHMMGGSMNGNHMMTGGGHMMGWWNPNDTSQAAMNRRMNMMGSCMGMQQMMMQQMMMQQQMQQDRMPKK